MKSTEPSHTYYFRVEANAACHLVDWYVGPAAPSVGHAECDAMLKAGDVCTHPVDVSHG